MLMGILWSITLEITCRTAVMMRAPPRLPTGEDPSIPKTKKRLPPTLYSVLHEYDPIIVSINQSLISLLFHEEEFFHRQNIRWASFQPPDVPRGTSLFRRWGRTFSANDPMPFHALFLTKQTFKKRGLAVPRGTFLRYD
ncbi:hypothetical protein [Pyramidobacter sp.]|uniref:hypothetical protein n=1 Tax=Pyramidobacter sp. TaxID=1943581 RepID=UPI0025E26B75|nr:hypothetical protein [Pyramidobacter sp.]MCI7403759.1 hypothetical protein [Pyramidobacter sp.]MDY3212690.1 hypothetical protein [Pyramidobacter sp.]